MVSSYLQLLQKKYGGQLDSKAEPIYTLCGRRGERMKALIMDLLEYSRVGSGKESFGWVDTAVVMEQVGDIFREKIIAARAPDKHRSPSLRSGVNRVQLTQLLQNLVGNALKYQSDQPPVIDIRAEERTGETGSSPSQTTASASTRSFSRRYSSLPAAPQQKRLQRHRHRPGHL